MPSHRSHSLAGRGAVVAVCACLVALTVVCSNPPLDERLANLLEAVEQRRVAYHIPGVALGVVKDGQVVLARGLGQGDMDSAEPVTPRTVFSIGSSTKSFTAVLAAMLADEGLVDLDAPLSNYLEGAALSNGVEPTLQDALSHATGLSRMPLLGGQPALTPEQMLDCVRQAELLYPYRTQFNYSNINFALAGHALAAAAGSDWHTLVRERLFQPLGMGRSTTTLAARDAQDDVAIGYEQQDGAFEPCMRWDLASIAAAGAINASLDDMLAWVRFLLAEGQLDDRRLVLEDSLLELFGPQAPMGPGKHYASGFMLERRDGLDLVHHGGNVPGFACQVLLVPELELGVVLMTNVMMSPLQDEVVELALQCLVKAQRPEPPVEDGGYPTDLERYTGRYRFAAQDMDMTVVESGGKLSVDVPGQMLYELRAPDDEGKWYFALTGEIAVSFEQGEDDTVVMTMHQAGMNIRMPRLRPFAGQLPSLREVLGGAPMDEVPSVLMVGEVDFVHQGLTVEYVVVADGPERMHLTMDLGPAGSMQQVVNGPRGWTVMQDGSVQELDADEARAKVLEQLNLLPGLWPFLYDPLEVVDQREQDGEMLTMLLGTRSNGDQDELWLDQQQRLRRSRMIMREGEMGAIMVETEYDLWRDVDGQLVPRRAVSMVPFVGRMELTLAVRLGISVPDGEFEQPVAPVAR